MEKFGLSTKRALSTAKVSHVINNTSNSSFAGRQDGPDAEVLSPSPNGQTVFLQQVRQASEAVSNGDFRRAVQAYTEAINLDPSNHILYTNRAAAFFKLNCFKESLQDARTARQINPKWAKAYLREGIALQHQGQHGEALAAFSAGLAQEPSSTHLLGGLSDTALKSPLKEKYQVTFQQLENLRLGRSPFVLMAVIGQELLAISHYSAAVAVLESALIVGTCSLKLRGSVFSALSSAHWGLGALDKAIYYMQQDLAVAKSLGDQEGECRAYGNLGSAFFSKGQYKESLTHHRFQLVLSMRLRQRQTAAAALSSLGHVYTAIGDYPNALASHKQCVLLLKQGGDNLNEAREIGNVGAVYLAMGNFSSAVECHQEHLKMARTLKSPVEEARAYSNLGSAYHFKRDYQHALFYHKEVLKIAEQCGDKTLEARAYAGLGHAARCSSSLTQAKFYHEKQLDNALQTRDKVAEGRSCANLGIIYHQLAEYEAALKLHKKHQEIAVSLADKASQGRACGNIGNAYSALGKHEQAIKYHKQALAISTEVNDCHSLSSTHGNLAVAYQSLGMYENALQHYLCHLNISQELKDRSSEARALCNLGNFHCARREYMHSVSYYEQYLVLSKELIDTEGEGKACFNLGYVHFNLSNFVQAIHYYEQNLILVKDGKDRLSLARAYCNLGLARKSLGHFNEALDCQKKCLRLMEALKNIMGRFRALGNIGDLMLKMGEMGEGIKIFNQQLSLAQQAELHDQVPNALAALGHAHRLMGQFDKALAYHTQELILWQKLEDLQGECNAYCHLGNVYTSMGNYVSALKCYQDMLERSQKIGSNVLEGQASGNLGITRMNLGQLDEAIGFFEQQLAMLEQQTGTSVLQDKARAFSNLGDCYEALGDYEEAVKWHEQCLILSQQLGNLADQDKAYRGLGNAHKAVGNLQQALVCFEKRLYVAHQLNSCAAKASAYGELGCLHSLLGNFEQAISCLEQQLTIAREMGDKECEGDAACGLGGVYQQMGEYETALKYHHMDLEIAETIASVVRQCRAYGNMGLSHESLGNYEDAVKHQEQHLSIAAEMNDKVAKTLAYSSLGRVHHALGHHTQAVQYLQQGLAIAEQQRRREDEAKIRHRLGLALWGQGNLEECQRQLNMAADLFETIRRESQCSSDYKLSLFDLQTTCYQALQCVLVCLGQHAEALVVAERACTRAFIDLLMERQAGSAGLFNGTTMDLSPVTFEQITSTVARQKALVLCFSVAGSSLYSWLMTPNSGLVKFHELSLSELENEAEGADTQSLFSFTSTSVFDHCIGQVRESMGIESHIATTSTGHRSSRLYKMAEATDTESETDSEVFLHHHEELVGERNAESGRFGFLSMVNRSHTFNSSTISLGSVFSLPNSIASLTTVSPHANFKKQFGKSPLSTLYQCLIAPMEEKIAQLTEKTSEPVDLVLVLQGDLYLIPFLMLKNDQADQFLFERFNLIIMPSISALQNIEKVGTQGRPVIESAGALVVGNPQLTSSICQHWHLKEIPGAEYEARILGELLSCRPLVGPEATKGAVLHQLEQVEVIHFAAHISWKLSSIVLSPGEFASNMSSQHFPLTDSEDGTSDVSTLGCPSLSEYLLTAADILNLKLHAKLVVLNSGYTDDRAGRVNTDGVVGLTRALLSAGAHCVLFSLWPVPDSASKLLMRTLYGTLIDGYRITQALSKAVKAVQSTKQFSHPANWGGWVLVGQDILLSSKTALMGHALSQILQSVTLCRETMRVLLHLMEKSLQRIQQGARNPMYTTVQSIENKVGSVSGWKELLQAVGFRFDPATSGLPPAVFFPQSDPSDRLTQASTSLQALLGLPPSSLTALSKFVTSTDVGEALIIGMREILNKLSAKEGGIDMIFNVQLWHVSGCHEFLASLGLDLVAVGCDNVTLRLSKQAVKRHLQFALQALIAVFNMQDAANMLSMDSSSSVESLPSSRSTSTPSGTPLSSPTPSSISPQGRVKRSLFNPAEMERMRNFQQQQLIKQGDWQIQRLETTSPPSLPRSPMQLDPSVYLTHQNRIRSMYGSSSNTESPTSDTQHTPLSTPSQDTTGDSDSAASYEMTSHSLLQLNNQDSIALNSKFTDKGIDPEIKSIQHTKITPESESLLIPRQTTSQLRQHYEQLNLQNVSANLLSSKFSKQQSQHGCNASEMSSKHKGLSEREERNVKADLTKKLYPEDIALKVLADVANQRAEVEFMQRQSAIRSLGHYKHNLTKLSQENNNSSCNNVTGLPSSSLSNIPSDTPCQQGNERIASLGLTSDASQLIPPSYPSPIPYGIIKSHTLSASNRHTGQIIADVSSGNKLMPNILAVHREGQSGENSISSDNSEGADSNMQSSVSSGYHSESHVKTRPSEIDRGIFTKNFVQQSAAGVIPSILSTTASSFRPYNPPTPLVYLNALHNNRPESSNSLSSHYSTASSNRSVIYRPLDVRFANKGKLKLNKPLAISKSPVSPVLRTESSVSLGGISAKSEDKIVKKVCFSESDATYPYDSNSANQVRLLSVEKMCGVKLPETNKCDLTCRNDGKNVTQQVSNQAVGHHSLCSERETMAFQKFHLKDAEQDKSINRSRSGGASNSQDELCGKILCKVSGVTYFDEENSESVTGYEQDIKELSAQLVQVENVTNKEPLKLSKTSPLYLDKDRRIIAKSSVLQSSKC